LRNKRRYIEMVTSDQLKLAKMTQDERETQLEEAGFDRLEDEKGYDYLLDMTFKVLNEDKIDSLDKQIEKVEDRYKTLKAKTPKSLWLEELSLFESAYEKFLKTRNDDVDLKKRKKNKKKVSE
jgi:hypothetical protein